jgi:hypothetical protein
MNTRNSILRGQKPNASHLGALQQADATLRNVCQKGILHVYIILTTYTLGKECTKTNANTKLL